MPSRNAAPLVAHVVHSLEGGGTERVLVALLKSFNHRELRHVVVTLREAGGLAAELPEEVACIALNTAGRSRRSALALARVMARLRPAVIHARNVCTWFDACIARVCTPASQLVLGFHGLEGGGDFSSRSRMVAQVAKSMGSRFASVSECGRGLIATQLGVPLRVISHLPNGVDPCRFRPPSPEDRRAARQLLGIGDHECVVGVVGSLKPVKAHDVLLEAVAQIRGEIPNIKLLIVGDGPLRGMLEEAARRLEIRERIEFCGWREDVAIVLHAMDAFVCCSRSEGMSNSLLEAMAGGLPVVSTAVGDHPDLLGNDVGLLIPADNAGALAEALKTLLSSKETAKELANRARARAEEFDFPNAVAEYERFYGSLSGLEPLEIGPLARICRSMSKTVIAASVSPVLAFSPLE